MQTWFSYPMCLPPPAMIVELKLNSSPGAALEQIKSRQYFNVLDKYQGYLLLVAVNYDKDTKKHSCIIEKFGQFAGK